MHDRIMENPKAVSADDLTKHAEALGLKLDSFKECLDSGKYTAAIRKDMAEGSKAGIRGTPSFLMGLTDPKDSKVKATKMLRGAVPYAQFKNALDELLASE
jgi:predicted DsbA family dithiol-disulfide isomerase